MFPMFAFIPWLGSFLAGLVTFFGTWLAKKWAITAGVIAGFIALTVAFTAVIHGLIVAIAFNMPGGYFQLGFSLLPGNTSLCLGTYLSAIVARWVYDYQYDFTSRMLEQGLSK